MGTPMRIGDAAQLLGISTDTVREWVRKGLLVASYTPTGQLVFDERDVEAARRGARRAPTPPRPPVRESVTKPDIRSCTHAWKDLAPWQAEVEAARAALALDELQAQRERLEEEREEQRYKRDRAAAAANMRAAEIQRLAQVKLEVFRVLCIDADARADVAAGLDDFATPEQVPGWLSHAEQFDLLAKRARQIVERVRADKRRQQTESQPSVNVNPISPWPLPTAGWPPASPPVPSTPPTPAAQAPAPPARPPDPSHPKPTTVAEALRSRGI